VPRSDEWCTNNAFGCSVGLDEFPRKCTAPDIVNVPYTLAAEKGHPSYGDCSVDTSGNSGFIVSLVWRKFRRGTLRVSVPAVHDVVAASRPPARGNNVQVRGTEMRSFPNARPNGNVSFLLDLSHVIDLAAKPQSLTPRLQYKSPGLHIDVGADPRDVWIARTI
jgi:hypothetical protein